MLLVNSCQCHGSRPKLSFHIQARTGTEVFCEYLCFRAPRQQLAEPQNVLGWKGPQRTLSSNLFALQEPKHINPWTEHPLARDAGPGSSTSCHNGEAMGHTGSGSTSPSASEDDQKGQKKGYGLILHLAALVSRAWGTPNTWQRASGISSRRFRISPAGQARQGADCGGTEGEQRDG